MTFRSFMPVGAGALCIAIFGALGAKQFANASAAVAHAEDALAHAVRDAEEVLDLRQREERIAPRPRPQEHLIAQVNATLAEVGIPPRKLRSVQPESDVALTNESFGASSGSVAGLRRQSVAISLQQVSVPELGGFLLRWREAHPIWTTSRIELLKHRGDDASAYDITIVVAATYLGES